MVRDKLHTNLQVIMGHLLLWALLTVGYSLYAHKVAVDAFAEHGDFLFFMAYQVAIFYFTARVVIPYALRRKTQWYYSLIGCLLLEMTAIILSMILLSIAFGELEIRFDVGKPFLVQVVNFFELTLPLFYGLSLGIAYYVIRWSIGLYITNRLNNKRIDSLVDEVEMLRQDWRKAQLSPHLLGNLLPTLRYTTTHKPKTAIKIMDTLVTMMRYYIEESKKGLIPLKEEIAQTQNLIKLNEMREGAKAHIKLGIEGQIEGLRTIPMLTLLLSENAFKHGIVFNENYPAKITIRRMGKQLFVHTKNYINTTANVDGTGNGLQNLRERLVYYYPEKHSFEYGLVGGLFEVKLCIDLI